MDGCDEDPDSLGTTGSNHHVCPGVLGAVTLFARFAHTTYKMRKPSLRALRGVEGHFRKYSTLRTLAERLAPGIREDVAELQERDYTAAPRSREVAAVVESLFCELYASLDCMREVLRAVLRSPQGGALQGIPSKKTSRLFSNAAEGKLASQVPGTIVESLASAQSSWFPELRDLRTNVVHYDVGFCAMTPEGTVSYMSVGLGSGNRAFVIRDVFGRLDELEEQVNGLLGTVFAMLVGTLNDVRTRQTCCIHRGRIYERMVSAQEALQGAPGVCRSYKWFDESVELRCPLSEDCSAYTRAREDGADPLGRQGKQTRGSLG
jgi:hypothetical protein